MKDKRAGRFRLSRYQIDERPEQIRAALKDMIVIEARYLGYSDQIEYVGLHPSFAPVSDFEMVPEYLEEIKTRGDGSVEHVAWRKR